MRSRISFFNPTVYKKNLAMYTPIWVCYLLYGLVKVPGRLWVALQQTKLTDAARYEAVGKVITLDMDLLAIAVMAAVCGMALFSYLFTAKTAYVLHALPVTRTELFFTNAASGLTFLFVPQFLVFLVTVLLCLEKGIACVQFLALWLVSVMGMAFYSFSAVCFCVMLTGQLFALPVYFAVSQYAMLAISYGCRYIISFLGYGLQMTGLSDPLVFRILSPLNYMKNNVQIVTELQYDSDYNVKQALLSYRGGGILAAYVLAAFGLFALAWFCYRRRRMESAGDLVTFRWLRPLFRWGVGLGSGFLTVILAAAFLDASFVQITKPLMLLLVAVVGTLGFFIAQMFVEKGFRVFHVRTVCECGVFLLTVCGCFFGLSSAAFRMEQYIPRVQDIACAYTYYNYPAEYTQSEAAEAVAVQKQILEGADRYRSSQSEDYTYIEMTYVLKDGSRLVRSYKVTADEPENLSLAERLLQQEKKPENYLYYLIGSDYAEVSQFGSGTLEMTLEDDSYRTVEFGADEAKTIYEAICRDVEAGVVQKYNLSNSLYTLGSSENPNYETANLMLDYKHPTTAWKDVYSRMDSSLSSDAMTEMMTTGSAYLSFGADCTNIIQALVDCGLVGSADEIVYAGPVSYE